MLRQATLNDLDDLVALEKTSFEHDGFSRRTFRYLLTEAHASTLINEDEQGLCGYVVVLFHSGTSLARLYSLAVHPRCQKKGTGTELMQAAEKVALDQDCISLRLEVRTDNARAIHLYRKLGYHQFGVHRDYYEDHMDALRFEKRLVQSRPDLARVPYYEQTLRFTCGPAALLMAMHALDPEMQPDRAQELRLWREATTIFMTSGHGGCGPYGLALSAWHRGFDVEVYVNDTGTLLVDTVRSEEKKEVMRIVQDDFLEELKSLPIAMHYRPLALDELQQKFNDGAIPIVLISSYRMYNERNPHWVVVTGFDDKYIYLHDPFVDHATDRSRLDSINMPIRKTDFEHMARYGRAQQKAAILIRQRKNDG
jgi:ribosomal-protein-alanine acetyltransferase